MSMKTHKQHRRDINKRGLYKLIDDKTGFVIYSDEAVVDYLGNITTLKNLDPIPYDFYPSPQFPDEYPKLSFVRPEQDGDQTNEDNLP